MKDYSKEKRLGEGKREGEVKWESKTGKGCMKGGSVRRKNRWRWMFGEEGRE